MLKEEPTLTAFENRTLRIIFFLICIVRGGIQGPLGTAAT
jgi:hypothetical protein